MEKQYRFPGLKPFSSDESAIFFGRNDDITNLCTSVIVNPTTLLFGKSGTGKSSLIQAGLVAELNKKWVSRQSDQYVPISIAPKIFDQNCKDTLCGKIISILKEKVACNVDNFLQVSDKRELSSFWYVLKQFQYSQEMNKVRKILLLIFDQAEELFTYPDIQIDSLVSELCPVLGNFIPDEFQRTINGQLASFSNEVNNAIYSALPVKFIFSIRSDKLHLLTRLKKASPRILQNSYELLPLGKEQAFESIDGPSMLQLPGKNFISMRFKISDATKEYIFRELSMQLKDPEYNFEETKVEPFSLQIICRHIEQEMVPVDGNELPGDEEIFMVTKKELETNHKPTEIINDYYLNCIKSLKLRDIDLTDDEKSDVRILIEEKMILENHRIPIHWKIIEQDKNSYVDYDVLETLVDARILSRNYDSYGDSIFEITHDCLINPILEAKSQRLAAESPAIVQILKEISQLESGKSSSSPNEDLIAVHSDKKKVLRSKVLSKNDELKLFKAYKKLGELYSAIPNYKKAFESFDNAIGSLGNQSNSSLLIEIYLARSDAYFYWGKYKESRENLDKILKLDPSNFTAMAKLLENYDKEDNLSEAFKYLLNLKISRTESQIYIELGNKFFDRKQYELAMNCYRKNIELNPDSIYAFYNLGLIEEQRENDIIATDFYQKSVDINPNYEDALLRLAYLHFKKQDWNSAKKIYQRLIKIDPWNELNYNDLGIIEERLTNLDRAMDCFEKAIKMKKDCDVAWHNLGRIQRSAGKLQEAIKSQSTAIALNSKDAEYHNELGLCYFDSKLWELAKICFHKAAAVASKDDLHIYTTNIGLVEAELGNIEAAENYYREAIKLNPRYDVAWYNLGLFQRSAGKLQEAIKSQKSAIALNSKDAEYHNELALCYLDSNLWELSKNCFQEAAAVASKDDLHIYTTNIGLAEAELGNIEAAENYYREAIKINPRYDTAWYNLGLLQRSAGQLQEAIKSQKNAIASNPKDAEYHNELGLCYFDSNLWELSKNCFQAAMAIASKDVLHVYTTNIGEAEAKLGNIEAAENYYKEAIKLNPRYDEVYNSYGELLMQMKKKEEAIDQFNICLRLNPDHALAKIQIKSVSEAQGG